MSTKVDFCNTAEVGIFSELVFSFLRNFTEFRVQNSAEICRVGTGEFHEKYFTEF
jgi:hypothetical protein